jgi:hypothetical protein
VIDSQLVNGEICWIPGSTGRKRFFGVASRPVKSQLPQTGTEDFLELLAPFVPDDYLDECWPRGKTGGRRHGFSASQLWRLHVLVLISPVHSFNLLIRMLPEQKAWRRFAHLTRQDHVPDVRMMNSFREEIGVGGLRRVNDQLLTPIMQSVVGSSGAAALIDATDLPASCSGFKKKHRPLLGPGSGVGSTHTQERPEPVVCRV